MSGAYVQNSNVIDLIGLRAENIDEIITNATVSATIKDADGATVAGPLTMTHIGDGNYRLFLSETLPFVANGKYIAIVEADGSNLTFGHFEFNFRPRARIVEDAA
jgi:hypothetical protein